MDTLRVEANERVDYGDFNYAVTEALEASIREVGEKFLTNPLGTVRSWILSGFGMTNPSGKQLVVTLGRAILSARVDGQLQYGYISADGDLTKTIDMASLTPTTYNVYLRFEIVDGDNSSRIFWDPSGSGSEFASTIATRRKANWSVRVETSNPGAEWVQIGTANNVGASLVLVDQRKFYFEGPVDASYQSGWSTDGGGAATDRNADRITYGVKDLQTFTAAARQCLEDIKGRGLRRWWERDIGGMNIGFDANPVEDRLAVGDAEFFMDYGAGTPAIRFATTGGQDELVYDRTANAWQFKIGGVAALTINAGGISGGGNTLYLGTDDYMKWDGTNWQVVLDNVEEARFRSSGFNVLNGIYVGDLTTVPTDDAIIAAGSIEAGTYLRATNGTIQTPNSSSYIYNSATGGNIYCNLAGVMWWTNAGLVSIYGGLRIGDAGAPTDNNLSVAGEGVFGGIVQATRFQHDSNDYIDWADNTQLNFVVNGVEEMRMVPEGLEITNGLYVGSLGTAPTDNDIYCEGSIRAGSYLSAGTYVGAGTYLSAGSYVVASTYGQIGTYLRVGGGSASLTTGDGVFGRGLTVGFDAAPIDNGIQVNDANFGLFMGGTDPYIQFESGSWIQCYRTDGRLAVSVLSAYSCFLDNDGVRPGADGTRTLGGSGAYWSNLWTRGIQFDGTDSEIYISPNNAVCEKPVTVRMYNNSGATVNKGDIVTASGGYSSYSNPYFGTTTGNADPAIGVAWETIGAGARGKIAVWGPAVIRTSQNNPAGLYMGTWNPAGNAAYWSYSDGGNYFVIGYLLSASDGTNPAPFWISGPFALG